MPSPDDFEKTGGIDPAAFAADLFPAAKSEPAEHSAANPEVVSPSAAAAPSAGSPPSTPVPAAAPVEMTQAAWDALPKAWKKEMEAEWKGLPETTRKYVHDRESQVTRGMGQYRSAAENWNKVAAPFESLRDQFPDANLTEILSTLANNHLQMVRATPEERRQHALALARGYGVDFAEAKAAVDAGTAPSPPGQDGFTPAQVRALQELLGPLVETTKQTSAFVNKQTEQATQNEVDKFFSDPKNEFAEEVAADILDLLKSGRVRDLGEAYQLAVLQNPGVKVKYLQKLMAEAAPKPTSASKLPNLKPAATPPSPAKPRTMDDTFAAVLEKHYPAGTH